LTHVKPGNVTRLGVGATCSIILKVIGSGATPGWLDMCLGIPMQVEQIDGFNARCEAKGVQRDVNLFLMQDQEVTVGDFVMVHVGYAIQKMTPEEARSAWETYDELLAMEEAARRA
jgi:hydrogenase expression/formation protein HypC